MQAADDQWRVFLLYVRNRFIKESRFGITPRELALACGLEGDYWPTLAENWKTDPQPDFDFKGEAPGPDGVPSRIQFWRVE